MASVHKLELQLRTPTVRATFLGAFCLVFVLFSYRIAMIAWATEQLETTDPSSVERALAVDGSNPALHNWAGVLYLSSDQPQPERAVRELQKAAQLNPRVADYWESLGRTCFYMNDLKCAEDAYERAVIAAPFQPSILNEFGMYYLATENAGKALPYFHRLLELDPSRTNTTVKDCLRSISPDLVWKGVVHDQSPAQVKFDFFGALRAQKMDQDAQRFWDEFISSRPTFAFADATAYLNLLQSQQRYADLGRVWQDLERLHIAGMPSRSADNLVVNGTFSQAPTNVGLDWHVSSEQFLDTQVVASENGYALRFDFTVPNNAEHESAYQLVPVVAGRHYEVRARVRSQDITSDSGPRLRVVDPACSDCVNVSSDDTTRTSDWHNITADFTASPTTNVVRLSIGRPRGRSFPADIQGQFWIEDISIRATN